MWVSDPPDWVIAMTDFADVTLVSEDTYWSLYWCDPGDTYGDDFRGDDWGGGLGGWQGGRHGGEDFTDFNWDLWKKLPIIWNFEH